MNIDTVLAFFALAVSAYAVLEAKKASSSQARLTDREVELVRQQLEKARREAREEKTADVSARLYKVATSKWRLKVFNKGPAVAENVHLELDDPQKSCVLLSDIEAKLPLKRMEKGGSVEISAAVSFGTSPKEEITVFWDDPDSAEKSKRIEITL